MAAVISTFLNFFLISSFLICLGNGSQSCVGPRGPSGNQGNDGAVGSGTDDTWYDVSPSRNWKECVWESSDSSDSGTIYTCSFTKQSSTSSLFVAYGGTTRLHGCHGCCGRWYFAFNGAECSNPQVIDGTVYMAHYSGADLHRYRKISGICDGLSAGSIDVSFHVWEIVQVTGHLIDTLVERSLPNPDRRMAGISLLKRYTLVHLKGKERNHKWYHA